MTPREAMAAMPEMPRYYATLCEMMDAAKLPTQRLSSAGAASIDLAALVTALECSLDDDRRAALIAVGGALIRLDNEIDTLFPGRSRDRG